MQNSTESKGTPDMVLTPLMHDVAGAVEVLGIPRTRLFAEIKAGRLASVKVGRRTMFKHADLERYVSELQSAA